MDIKRNNSLVKITGDLEIKHVGIQVNEKKSLVKSLQLRLDDLVNIDMKKIEFQIDVLQKEIEILTNQLAINV